MDLFKGGWHPSGDKEIHRATWKKDLKNIASRKDEQAVRAKDHVSAPLSSLKDPDTFGPPPKHTGYHSNAQSPATTTPSTSGPATGLESPVPRTPVRSVVQQEQEQEQKPAGPYKVNTTGLRTDNLPKPPGRRELPITPVSTNSPVSRTVPALPPRKATGGPPPGLPPRQSETPNEYTPPAPPSYGEAMSRDPLSIDTGAVRRLGQVGVNVPGLNIGGVNGSSGQPAGHASQVSELQQRFARMNASASPDVASPDRQTPTSANTIATGVQSATTIAGLKKKPPPPPSKKAELGAEPSNHDTSNAPPPIPMSSK